MTFVGYNGDGHLGRLNLTTSVYYAFGDETPSVLVNQKVDISALFAAAGIVDGLRLIRRRVSLLYGSGDDDPFDDEANRFRCGKVRGPAARDGVYELLSSPGRAADW